MSVKLIFETSEGNGFSPEGGFSPGGFVTDYDGYLCFIEPEIHGVTRICYRWIIQEGGGWTHRGGETVVRLAEGIAYSSTQAEELIIKWLEEHQTEA